MFQSDTGIQKSTRGVGGVIIRTETHPNYDASRFLPTRAVVENAKVKKGGTNNNTGIQNPTRGVGGVVIKDARPHNDASRFLPTRADIGE